jgi:hypothetical protein
MEVAIADEGPAKERGGVEAATASSANLCVF